MMKPLNIILLALIGFLLSVAWLYITYSYSVNSNHIVTTEGLKRYLENKETIFGRVDYIKKLANKKRSFIVYLDNWLKKQHLFLLKTKINLEQSISIVKKIALEFYDYVLLKQQEVSRQLLSKISLTKCKRFTLCRNFYDKALLEKLKDFL